MQNCIICETINVLNVGRISTIKVTSRVVAASAWTVKFSFLCGLFRLSTQLVIEDVDCFQVEQNTGRRTRHLLLLRDQTSGDLLMSSHGLLTLR